MYYIKIFNICIIINLFFFPIFSNSSRILADFAFLSEIQDIDIFSFDLFYIHVPLSVVTVILFLIIFIYSISYFLGWRNFNFLIWRQSFLLINILFCIAAIVSGELWSISTWGTLAPLDARYVALLLILITNILVFISVHIALCENKRTGLTLSNFLLLFSLFNYPIVKYSVIWWNSIHMSNIVTWTSDNNRILFAIDELIWVVFLFVIFATVSIVQVFLVLDSFYRFDSLREYAEIR